jgi:hypothetical protein
VEGLPPPRPRHRPIDGRPPWTRLHRRPRQARQLHRPWRDRPGTHHRQVFVRLDDRSHCCCTASRSSSTVASSVG